MNAPAIDFAPAGRRTLRWPLALLVAASLACGLVAWRCLVLQRELASVQASIATASAAAHLARSAKAPPPPKIEAARLSAVNSAIARLNIPWSELLPAFEGDAGNDVALLALLPDPKRRVVLVQAEARDARAMVAFAERLRLVAPLTHAFLVKHERRDQEPGQPFRFTMEVRWEASR